MRMVVDAYEAMGDRIPRAIGTAQDLSNWLDMMNTFS